MDRLRALAAVCALSFVVLATKIVVADAPPPPPPITCTKDTDCPGCQRCTGGVCPGVEIQQKTCMCHEECTEAGTVCDLSPTKPLCGGTCVKSAAKREIACGAGDDVPTIESVQTPISDRADGAKLIEGNAVVITLIEVPK